MTFLVCNPPITIPPIIRSQADNSQAKTPPQQYFPPQQQQATAVELRKSIPSTSLLQLHPLQY